MEERKKTGQFKKGHKGFKPKGAISEKTKQWELLGESLTTGQSENFNSFLNELWNGNKQDKLMAADLMLKTVEYFKPKLQRTESKIEQETTIKGITFEDA